jgi:hypothetical protein
MECFDNVAAFVVLADNTAKTVDNHFGKTRGGHREVTVFNGNLDRWDFGWGRRGQWGRVYGLEMIWWGLGIGRGEGERYGLGEIVKKILADEFWVWERAWKWGFAWEREAAGKEYGDEFREMVGDGRDWLLLGRKMVVPGKKNRALRFRKSRSTVGEFLTLGEFSDGL